MKKLTFFFGILLILLIGINSPKSAAFAPIASSGGSKIFEGTDAISFYCEVNSDTVLQNLMHFHDANDLTTCSQVNSTCPSPANLQVNAISSCAILVSWNGTGEASNFKVRYRISGTAQWTTYAVGSDTSFTISGLTASTSYQISVVCICRGNSTSGWTQPVEIKTPACSVPLNPIVTDITSDAATIEWLQPCSSSGYNLLYRIPDRTSWTSIADLEQTHYTLTNLLAGTTYEFRIASDCGRRSSTWSATQQFTTATIKKRPNIVMIMTDDDRYDSYTINGGPDWFVTPNITRIAKEGVNFKIMIPSTSQCAPSRSSIYTGRYAHDNKCFANGVNYDHSLPQIQKILGDHGYYTGFVGKFGQNLGKPDGFDWWAKVESKYGSPDYTLNDIDYINASTHISDLEPTLALQFLNSIPADTPFLLFYYTFIPHSEALPKDEDTILFEGEMVPQADNVAMFHDDYPTFYYNEGEAEDTSGNGALRRRRYQCLAEHERGTDTLITWLKEHGQLDNTLLVYCSDNGFMLGEHFIEGKRFFLEESCRVPLFIRYPAWFTPGQVVTDQIATTIDFAPTFLEAAGIENTFGFYGLSLHKLANHEVYRQKFLYEFGPDDHTPVIRGVRSLTGKYISDNCTSTTEEFYNLMTDPKENTNLIYKPECQDSIQLYRQWLDALRNNFGDTVQASPFNCALMNNFSERIADREEDENEFEETFVQADPNPAQGAFIISFGLTSGLSADEICIYDVSARMVNRVEVKGNAGEIAMKNNQLEPGIYSILLRHNGRIVAASKLVITK